MKSIVEPVTGKFLWSGENPATKPSLAGYPVVDSVPPGEKFYLWDFALNGWKKDVATETAHNAEVAKTKAKGQNAKVAHTSFHALVASNPNWAIPANIQQAMELLDQQLNNVIPGVPD